jgi:hypothetical protein
VCQDKPVDQEELDFVASLELPALPPFVRTREEFRRWWMSAAIAAALDRRCRPDDAPDLGVIRGLAGGVYGDPTFVMEPPSELDAVLAAKTSTFPAALTVGPVEP